MSLKTKTEKYAWLFISYLLTEKKMHEEKYPGFRARAVDIHREDMIAIPYVRSDRMDENPKLIAELLNVFRQMRVPNLLESRDDTDLYDDSLSFVLTNNGLPTLTIEEGRAAVPDDFEFHLSYAASVIAEFLVNEGVVRVNDEKWRERITVDDFTWPALKKSRALWKEINQGMLYCLTYLQPTYFDRVNQKSLSQQDLISAAFDTRGWDGLFSLSFQLGLRGNNSKDKIPQLATLGFVTENNGAFSSYKENNIHLILPTDLPHRWWIISVPEGYSADHNSFTCGFVFDEKKRKIKLKILSDEETDSKKYLSPEQIKKCLEYETVAVDLSALDITFATPDPIWDMSLGPNDELELIKKT